nr:IclR family transcriptional regulator C-terminal domain-containing protein [Gemmobacter caeni]
MLVIATVPGRSPIEIGVRVGSLLSFHGSAQGKVATAFSSEAFQRRVLTGALTAFTEHTLTDPALLAAEFEVIRRRGWATAPNQAALGLNTLASPILDGSGAVCGSVGIVDLTQSLAADPGTEHAAAVLETARQISVLMGHSGPLPFG